MLYLPKTSRLACQRAGQHIVRQKDNHNQSKKLYSRDQLQWLAFNVKDSILSAAVSLEFTQRLSRGIEIADV